MKKLSGPSPRGRIGVSFDSSDATVEALARLLDLGGGSSDAGGEGLREDLQRGTRTMVSYFYALRVYVVMAAEPLGIVCAGKQRFYGRDKNLPSSTFDNSSEEFLLASMVNESCLNLTFTPFRFLIVNMVDEGRLLMLQPSNSYFAYRPILQVLKSEVRVCSRYPSRVAPDLRPAASHARHLFEQSGMIFNLYTMPRPTFDKGLATVLVFCLAFATSDREIPRLRIFGGWISCHCIPRKNTVSALPSTIATLAPATLNSMSRAATSPM